MSNSLYSSSVSSYSAVMFAGAAVGLSALLGVSPSIYFQREQLPVDMAKYHYSPGNAEVVIGIKSSVFTGDVVTDNYKPRTALGKKLIAMRRAYAMSGGKFLTTEELESEMKSRRGGTFDA